MADAGFDVWLGNIRGNTYSMEHRDMTTLNYKFWDFRRVNSTGVHEEKKKKQMMTICLSYDNENWYSSQ